MPHSSDQWCPRCSEPVESSGAPCSYCWECQADEAAVEWLVDWARGGNRAAISCLGRIRDHRATPALRMAACDTSPQVRSGALVSLGRSGGPDDAALIATALHDEHADVRRAARLALAELGGTEARDRLAATLARLDDAELDQAVDALAWLRDGRALPFAHARLDAHPRSIHQTPGFRVPGWALVRLGGRDDLMRVRDEGYAAAQLPPATIVDLPAGATPREVVMGWAYGLLGLYRPEHADLWPEVAELFAARAAPYAAEPPVPSGPEQPRTVPKRAMVALSPEPLSDPPAAKFGGHPEWLAQPQWPLEPDGRPMTFYGQLPLPEHPGHVAYMFIGRGDDSEPLADGNAVVIQPACTCHRPTVPATRGPRIFERVHELDGFVQLSYARAYERFVELRDQADPARWEPEQHLTDRDWNKIGGTPYFLQDEQWPPGDGWRFVSQFAAGWAGMELADGAECYVFVRDDLSGAFLWQCH